MCTCITYHHYFGRTLDVTHSYNEKVVITPRHYPFKFKTMPTLKTHYAIIGIAKIVDDYPLYFDATNEKGLSIAGLNFNNSNYGEFQSSFDNIAPFELIPWILSQCSSIEEAKKLLQNLQLVNIPFNDHIPLASLHWMLSDQKQSITLEYIHEKLVIQDNDIGVLTNEPAYDIQRFYLNQYLSLSTKSPTNTFSKKIDLKPYSQGMGGLGLPGDLSSLSRFVRATYHKFNALCEVDDYDAINQFFHILGSVKFIKGCVLVDSEYEMTAYTSCCDMNKGIYYYTSYAHPQIIGVDMHKENIDGTRLIIYDLLKPREIYIQNQKIT